MANRPLRRATVLVADDHAVVADGLAGVLQPYYTVQPSVTSLTDLLPSITCGRPDVVVLDLSFGGDSSLPVIASAMARLAGGVRFVVLTAHESPAMARAAIEAGASAFLLKGCSVQDLRLAIDAAIEGRRIIPAILGDDATKTVVHRPARQLEIDGVALRISQVTVLLMLLEGLTRREIASRLGISVRGVDHHLRVAKQAIGIRNLKLLVRWVAEHAESLEVLLNRSRLDSATPRS